MSTYIKYTNGDNKIVTEQQLSMLTEFNHHTYDKETNELKKIEKFIRNYKTKQVEQRGGEVFVSSNDDLNDIINNHIGIGILSRGWTFYYNKQSNNKGDVQWEFVTYIKGVLKDKGIFVFDNKGREIVSCSIDLLSGDRTSKRKCFFGDPAIFFYSFGDENIPNIVFRYNDDNSIREVFYYDDDYTLDEFLANEKIMAQFPWDQHTYFHSFEPMLPNN
ncbi:hypothetical protein [Cloacibacterium normanense]